MHVASLTSEDGGAYSHQRGPHLTGKIGFHGHLLVEPRLVPRPSHRPVFDCLQYAGGRPGLFYHVNDVLSTLVDTGGEGSPIENTSLMPYLVVSSPSTGVLNVHEVKVRTAPVSKRRTRARNAIFRSGTPPPPPPFCLPR